MHFRSQLRNFGIASFALLLAACSEGVDGLDGDAGPMGAPGVKGDPGNPGDDGDPGPKGDTGATGASGAMGASGAQGDMGATGAQGSAGDAGPQGAMGGSGATGAQGLQGARGDAGPAGATGATGGPGATGPTGATGAVGATGATGARGARGDAGAPGATGATGPMGARGDAGAPGATGATGATGSFSSDYMYAFTNGGSQHIVPNSSVFFFDGVPLSQGFNYDTPSGIFTAQKAGIYHVELELYVDDGGVVSTPTVYQFQMAGVGRPSDSYTTCPITESGVSLRCSASFLMEFAYPGQMFAFVNVGQDMYLGTYEGNPSSNIYRLNIFQLY